MILADMLAPEWRSGDNSNLYFFVDVHEKTAPSFMASHAQVSWDLHISFIIV